MFGKEAFKKPFVRRSMLALTMSLSMGAMLSALPNTSMAADSVFDSAEQEEIKKIVREYLISNPEILVETAKALEERQALTQEAAMEETIEFFKNSEMVPYRGKKNAKHYVIEFFDYNCGYCKVVRPHIKKLYEENDVRVIYVEFPILSALSARASAIGLALYMEDKEKYLKYQDILMEQNRRITEESQIKEAVEKVGGDYAQLSIEINDNPKIQEALRSNIEYGQKIGVQGTPFFIIDGNVIRGAVKDYDTLKDLLSK